MHNGAQTGENAAVPGRRAQAFDEHHMDLPVLMESGAGHRNFWDTLSLERVAPLLREFGMSVRQQRSLDIVPGCLFVLPACPTGRELGP